MNVSVLLPWIRQLFNLLTLIRLPLEKLARTWGYPVRTPFEKEGFQEGICSKNHVFLKADINSNSFGSFSESFSKITKEIGENCNSIKNLLRMRKNSQFAKNEEKKFVIFELCQHAIPLKKAFLQRTQFKIFSILFLSKSMLTTCLPTRVSQIVPRKFKYELTCALERF